MRTRREGGREGGHTLEPYRVHVKQPAVLLSGFSKLTPTYMQL